MKLSKLDYKMVNTMDTFMGLPIFGEAWYRILIPINTLFKRMKGRRMV